MTVYQAMMGQYVYAISHTVGGAVYIGITSDPDARWKRHLCLGDPSNQRYLKHSRLHDSMRKYGPDQFVFSVLEEWPSRAEVLEAEQWWVTYLRSLGATLLNMTSGGEGSVGFKHSAESIAKMRKSQGGRKATPAQIAHLRRRRHSDATKAKMRAFHASEEGVAHLENRREICRNRVVPEEECVRRSIASRNSEACRRHQESLKGRVKSEETCRRLSKSTSAYWARVRAARAAASAEMESAFADALPMLAALWSDEE